MYDFLIVGAGPVGLTGILAASLDELLVRRLRLVGTRRCRCGGRQGQRSRCCGEMET